MIKAAATHSQAIAAMQELGPQSLCELPQFLHIGSKPSFFQHRVAEQNTSAAWIWLMGCQCGNYFWFQLIFLIQPSLIHLSDFPRS